MKFYGKLCLDLVLLSQLQEYGTHYNWPMEKLKFHRTANREGLIRAKILGSELAQGKYLVFLDSHCEVGYAWLEPLISRLQEEHQKYAKVCHMQCKTHM